MPYSALNPPPAKPSRIVSTHPANVRKRSLAALKDAHDAFAAWKKLEAETDRVIARFDATSAELEKALAEAEAVIAEADRLIAETPDQTVARLARERKAKTATATAKA